MNNCNMCARRYFCKCCCTDRNGEGCCGIKYNCRQPIQVEKLRGLTNKASISFCGEKIDTNVSFVMVKL